MDNHNPRHVKSLTITRGKSYKQKIHFRENYFSYKKHQKRKQYRYIRQPVSQDITRIYHETNLKDHRRLSHSLPKLKGDPYQSFELFYPKSYKTTKNKTSREKALTKTLSRMLFNKSSEKAEHHNNRSCLSLPPIPTLRSLKQIT